MMKQSFPFGTKLKPTKNNNDKKCNKKKKTLRNSFFSVFSVKDLKQCLRDAGDTDVQLSLGAPYVERTAPPVVPTCEAQPGSSPTVTADSKAAPQTSPSESPSLSLPSARTSQDVQMEQDCAKPEAQVPAETSAVPRDAKDAEEARGHDQPAQSCPSSVEATPAVGCEDTCPAPSVVPSVASSLSAAVAEPQPAESSVQVEINEEIVTWLKAAVDEHRTALASKAAHREDQVSLKL